MQIQQRLLTQFISKKILLLSRAALNTQAQSDGGAIGASRVWAQGFVGASLSTYQSDYGTPAEDEVTIAMKSRTLSLKGEQRGLSGWLKSVAAQANTTRYAHTELDAGTPATEFSKRGGDARLELVQTDSKWGGNTLTGTSLLSTETERFSALGAEAFVPNNKTSQYALATVQTINTAWGSVTAGARVDKVSVESNAGTQTDYSGADKFIPAKRNFTPTNFALSGVYKLSSATQLLGSATVSQRAPASYELFANGAHIATGAYEMGNANLGKERSNNLDVALQWREGSSSFKLGGFYNRFKNFISLSNTGVTVGADGEPSPVDSDADGVADASGESILSQYQYQAIRARFMGLEAQGKYRLVNRPYTLDVNAKFDTLNAINVDTNEALSRIAPMRVTLGLNFKYQGWQANIDWAHNAKQSKVPSNDTLGTTPSYNLVNLGMAYRSPQRNSILWFAKVDNVFNKLAYNAVTIDTVRSKSPLAGRSLKLGLQVMF